MTLFPEEVLKAPADYAYLLPDTQHADTGGPACNLLRADLGACARKRIIERKQARLQKSAAVVLQFKHRSDREQGGTQRHKQTRQMAEHRDLVEDPDAEDSQAKRRKQGDLGREAAWAASLRNFEEQRRVWEQDGHPEDKEHKKHMARMKTAAQRAVGTSEQEPD